LAVGGDDVSRPLPILRWRLFMKGRKMSAVNLIGERFGRLLVVDVTEKSHPKKGHIWLCHCDCGNDIEVPTSRLTHKITTSCGCLRKELARKKMTVHGYEGTRLYKCWDAMKRRCNDKTGKWSKTYKNIIICDEWLDPKVFIDWALANGYNNNLTLDRIDNTKGYYPENCRWATPKEQARNRANNKYITYNDKRRLFIEVLEEHGIMPGTKEYQRAYYRVYKLHWSMERALSA